MADESTKRLVSLIDRRILPLVTTLYLCGYLCRVNIANVHSEINESLHISEQMYGSLVAAFFVGYTLFEVPSNLCLKRFGAHIWLSFLSFTWGLFALLSAFSPNFYTLLIYRLLVGSFEAGIFPGILYYLSYWYVKSERGFRYSIFYLSSLIGSSISGLLASALLQLDSVWSLDGWRWVLLIQSVPSILMSPVILIWLPRSFESADWLNDDLKALASSRNNLCLKVAEEEEVNDDFNGDLEVNIPRKKLSTMNALKNPIIWMFSILYLFVCTPVAAVSFFLPRMIELQLRLSSVFSNLVIVPIYLIAAIFVLFFSRNSDRLNERPLHLIIACSIGFVGFVGLFLFGDANMWTSLALTQIAVIGTSSTIPIAFVWLSSVIPSNNQSLLAVATGTMATFGQISGLVTPALYAYLASLASGGDDSNTDDYKYAHLSMAIVFVISVILIMILRGCLSRDQLFVDSKTDDEQRQPLIIEASSSTSK